MTERLLQFIWQHQYYNNKQLLTTEGDELLVMNGGRYNTNQGPDFLDAKIKIGKTVWAGSVELHTKTSDWKTHKHSDDAHYNNVILHVVWENDKELSLGFPCLVLQDKVSKLLLEKYEELMLAKSFIPCDASIKKVNEITWMSFKERLLAERMQNKSQHIFALLEKSKNHWEETLWKLLARNFGIPLNSQAFEEIGESIPLSVLAKHKNQIQQLEALLLGQAGLLEKKQEKDYTLLLQREYLFLQKKYGLKPIKTDLVYLRMRPSNFPTLRLAQLAMLVHDSSHLLSKIKETEDVASLKKMLQVTANDFWHYHYTLDVETGFKKKQLGEQMIQNIIINTVAPILFAYGHYHRDQKLKDRALNWLMEVKAEANSITRGFAALDVIASSAFDSQALIQLKNEYCNNKRCLECMIGNRLLKEL